MANKTECQIFNNEKLLQLHYKTHMDIWQYQNVCTINFYNNLETQTEKVNKSEYFIEAWQLHVRVVNAEVERTVGFTEVTILMSNAKVWKVLPIPRAPYQLCYSGSLIENTQNTIIQDIPTHAKEDS